MACHTPPFKKANKCQYLALWSHPIPKFYILNSLGPIVPISVMRLYVSWCHFQQCPLDRDRFCFSRKGRWVGAPEGYKQHGHTWACL